MILLRLPGIALVSGRFRAHLSSAIHGGHHAQGQCSPKESAPPALSARGPSHGPSRSVNESCQRNTCAR